MQHLCSIIALLLRVQYSISMQTVNKEIWKTILMAPPSSGQIQTQAQATTKKKKSVAGMFYYVLITIR